MHKFFAINMWLSGKTLRDVESYFARGGADDVVAGMFLSLLNRLGALLPAVAGIARIGSSETDPDLREVVRRLTLQVSIGGGKDVAALHRLRLGLTRGQCLKLVEMGIRDSESLRGALDTREAELQALLSTPRFQQVKTLVGDRRYQARMAAPEPQLTLDGFE